MKEFFKRTPELSILLGGIIVTYAIMGLFSQLQGNEILSANQMWVVAYVSEAMCLGSRQRQSHRRLRSALRHH